ncbi:peroxisomal carnitine O-octanoyltransferase isoform X5 [Equus przewalskii]|uniref:Peroxisomal carnitine O-octanoyltransferase isoform X5 n=1 Tax=Equus przewalskii TaxID=9798 RepID=A0ABM4P8E1_EQUPR|nr:peroxisomal carnitine O-octanoyltransferase isoform X3 [Equus caballus]
MFGWSCLSLGGLLSVQSCPWVGGRSLRSRRRLLLLEPSVERLSPATGRRHRIPGHRDVLCILWTCLMERSTIVRNLVNPVVIFIQLSSRWTFACVGCDYQNRQACDLKTELLQQATGSPKQFILVYWQLTYIHQKCHSEPDGPGIAALTSEERTRWAKAREYLVSLDPENLTMLEKIQSSLLVYSIEDGSPHVTPEDYSQVTTMLLTGDPTVRWGDKSYNLISFANGVFGCNCDHAPYDAMIIVNISHYIDEKILENEGRWKGSENVRDIPLPEELIFTVDEKVLDDINQAKAQYLKQASDLQIFVYAFTSFGKKLTKKMRLHPDTFVQLALQLAYYRLHGCPGCCYETAMTRYFYHGRTETVRSCTVEAVRWCQSMQNPYASLLERQQKMLQAFAKHNKMMKDCSTGKGFDRHLLGLSLIAKEEGLPIPELFTDPLFSKSGGGGNFVLSTSLIGYFRIQGVVAPMVHNGYGFFYHIRDNRFVVACTAWKSCPETDAEKLIEQIFHAFHDMIQLMNTAHL